MQSQFTTNHIKAFFFFVLFCFNFLFFFFFSSLFFFFLLDHGSLDVSKWLDAGKWLDASQSLDAGKSLDATRIITKNVGDIAGYIVVAIISGNAAVVCDVSSSIHFFVFQLNDTHNL